MVSIRSKTIFFVLAELSQHFGKSPDKLDKEKFIAKVCVENGSSERTVKEVLYQLELIGKIKPNIWK